MAANRNRNAQLAFRCTAEELAMIDTKAATAGMNRTEFLINALSEKEIIVYPGMREILAELKREGINLNQALRFANHDQMRVPELNEAIKNCNELYKKLLNLWQEANGKTVSK